MALTLVTPPPVEPVSLDQAKTHLRVTATDQDDLIRGLIAAAREHLEAMTKRAFVYQVWDWTLDGFPRWFKLPKPPLQSIVSIKYLDDAGAEQTLATTVYRVDAKSQPARVTVDYGQIWPTTYPVINAVTVRFACGFFSGGSPADYAEDTPPGIKTALKLLVAHFYENREAVTMAPNIAELPIGIRALVMPHCVDLV